MPVFARIGILTTILTFLGGIWLFLAPFIVGYQKVGQDWIDATKNDIWTGGALMVVAVITILLFAAFGLRDAAHAARRRDQEREKEERREQNAGENHTADRGGVASSI